MILLFKQGLPLWKDRVVQMISSQLQTTRLDADIAGRTLYYVDSRILSSSRVRNKCSYKEFQVLLVASYYYYQSTSTAS